MKFTLWSAFALALVAATPASPGGFDTSRIDGNLLISDASVAVRCPLTIGGSFEAKTNALGGELVVDLERHGEVDGALAVDLRTLQTGIGLRDTHMLERYLEVDRGAPFATATISRIRLDGINITTPRGKATFKGVLALHGQEREVTGTADIRQGGQVLRVQASFPINVSDFDIPSATYLGVGVRNQLTVAVTFQAAWKRPA
jgi:polyisoprenoid-binding protein YceI